MTGKPKLGAVSFLNAEPLVWPLQNGKTGGKHDIIRSVPSELIGMLEEGEIDCALVSIACLLDNPNFVPVPDIAIACRGAVASVALFQNGKVEDLEKIWLDPASRTSNLLLKVLRDNVSNTPCTYLMPEDEEPPEIEQLKHKTGRLIIGDSALKITSGETVHPPYTDLGEWWREVTNHPFTFARWIARNGDIAAELKDELKDARDWSLLHLHEFSGELAESYGFSHDIVDRYLRTNLVYMHGPREMAGEREFMTMAKKIDAS